MSSFARTGPSRIGPRILVTLVVAAAAAVGCTIGGGTLDNTPAECGELGSHSSLNTATNECVCDAGYNWCDPTNGQDYSCCMGTVNCGSDPLLEPDPSGSSCICVAGYDWCNPSDLTDYSCCATGTGTDTGTGTGTSGGQVDCTGKLYQPLDSECTAMTEGSIYCDTTTYECAGEASYYVCQGGAWVPQQSAIADSCMFDGFSLGLGCFDTGTEVKFVCADGPGTACDGTMAASCTDATHISECKLGSIVADDCMKVCMQVGDAMGITYDVGTCELVEGVAQCSCCDLGTPGCTMP